MLQTQTNVRKRQAVALGYFGIVVMMAMLVMGANGSIAQTPVPQLIRDIRTASQAAGLEKFGKVAVLGNQLFFTANDGTSGEEPYVTDGTTAGTLLLKDIRPGIQSSIPNLTNAANFSGFAVVNGKVLFAANDGINGMELWVSDGTSNGTVLLKDIAAGSSSGSPNNFFVWNDKVLFTASTVAEGRELWITDGTAAGTVLLKDINLQVISGNNTTSSNPTDFALLNGRVYFAATTHTEGRELWVTDGTANGTVLFKNIVPETSWWINVFSSSPNGMTLFNGKLYFEANGSTNGNDRELWATDGTVAGTTLVKDINPQTDGNSWPNGFFAYDNRLYFQADDGTHGQELWATDGTEAGTVLVKDLVPGTGGSGPANFFVFNNRLCFSALNQLLNGFYTLWISDGTESGTQQYLNMYPNRLRNTTTGIRAVVVGDRAFLAATPVFPSSSASLGLWLVMLDSNWNTTLLFPANQNTLGHIPVLLDNGFHRLGNLLVFAGSFQSSVSSEPYKLDISSFAETQAQWIGGTSNDWHTASNWSNNLVPDAQTVVVIPAGSTQCVVSAANAIAKRVTVAAGAQLRLENGRVLIVSQ